MEGYLPILELIFFAVLTGFFFSIEPAMGTLNHFAIELKKKQGKASGLLLSEMLSKPSGMIAAALVSGMLTLTATVLVSIGFSGILWQIFPTSWKDSPLKMIPEWITASLVLFFSVSIIVSYVKTKSNAILGSLSKPLYYINLIGSPIGTAFMHAGEWILQYLFDVRLHNKKELFKKMDPEQLIGQMKDNEDEGALKADLFENALSLPGVKIRECLIPRKEIVGIEIKSDMAAVRRKFIDTQLSRLVVYEDNIDRIKGYVHQQDLFKRPVHLHSVLHPIPAVPESMAVTDLIDRFTKERKSIAWVVDEFGGTAGIVTMEDLLEEIFGEIKDEYDTEDFIEKETEPGNFIFSGRLELDYLSEKYHLDFDKNSESETLSGYIVEFHETIPKVKETIIIHQLEFEIISVSDTRIETVKVKLLGSA
ncbi:MAG: hemolysin family protein [Bacteroidota bacterium]